MKNMNDMAAKAYRIIDAGRERKAYTRSLMGKKTRMLGMLIMVQAAMIMVNFAGFVMDGGRMSLDDAALTGAAMMMLMVLLPVRTVARRVCMRKASAAGRALFHIDWMLSKPARVQWDYRIFPERASLGDAWLMRASLRGTVFSPNGLPMLDAPAWLDYKKIGK